MRRAVLKVTPLILAHFWFDGEHHFRVKSGLPPDAKYITSWYSSTETCFYVCYESSQFLEVKEGDLLPVLAPPEVTKLSVNRWKPSSLNPEP